MLYGVICRIYLVNQSLEWLTLQTIVENVLSETSVMS